MGVTINSPGPFLLTLPDSAATVAGVVTFDLGAALGAVGTNIAAALALAGEAADDAAEAKADAAVALAMASTVIMGPIRADLDSSTGSWYVKFQPRFDGTLTRWSAVTAGDDISAGAATLTLRVGGVQPTGGVLSFAPGAADGTAASNALGGAAASFTRDQIFFIEMGGTNASLAYAGITIEATRG